MSERQPTGKHTHADELGELLASASCGDESAWRRVVDLYARRVFALVRSRLGHRGGEELCEEVTQSVFVTVATKLGSGDYTESGRFEAWLFRIAMNRIRDEARRMQRRGQTLDPSLANHRPTADANHDGLEHQRELTKLRDAMSSLTDADREVIELRHHGGMSFRQMCDLLNEPMGTLLARHHRALRKLRELMDSPEAVERAPGG